MKKSWTLKKLSVNFSLKQTVEKFSTKKSKKSKKVIDFRERAGYKPVCRRDEARLKDGEERRRL